MADESIDPALHSAARRIENDKYASLALRLVEDINLGYDVEQDNPHTGFEKPQQREIAWLAAWLISEGWEKK